MKEPVFPRVERCERCSGFGCVNRSCDECIDAGLDNCMIFVEECWVCDGHGYVIPAEWVEK